jgi:hypothetical protein
MPNCYGARNISRDWRTQHNLFLLRAQPLHTDIGAFSLVWRTERKQSQAVLKDLTICLLWLLQAITSCAEGSYNLFTVVAATDCFYTYTCIFYEWLLYRCCSKERGGNKFKMMTIILNLTRSSTDNNIEPYKVLNWQ